jgi:hypothetical protein
MLMKETFKKSEQMNLMGAKECAAYDPNTIARRTAANPIQGHCRRLSPLARQITPLETHHEKPEL